VAAAWLSPVSVIMSMALTPIAAHHGQVRPDPAAITAAASSAKLSRASQTAPTLLSKSVRQNSSVLRGVPGGPHRIGGQLAHTRQGER